MTISSLLAYLQILLKVKFIRAVYHSTIFTAKLTGKILLSLTKPFETIFISSTKSNRRIQVDVYRTAAALEPDAGPVAVHLNWHGSGYVVTSFGESRPFIEYLLKHETLSSYPLVIFDCDYAKAPEYPCPAATDDARDVLDYIFQHPDIYDLRRVTIGGFSAGGCMALGTSVQVGSEFRKSAWPHSHAAPSSPHPIRAVIAFYPPTTWEKNHVVPTIPEGAKFPGFLPTNDMMDTFDAAYFFPPTLDVFPSAPSDIERVQRLQQEPLLCPSLGDPKDFPQTIALITVEYDILTHETEEFRKKLQREKDKDVYGWSVPKVGHAWDVMVLPDQVGFQDRARAYDLAAKVIARAGGVEVDI